MPERSTETVRCTPIVRIRKRERAHAVLRHFDPSCDSYEQLTAMLHRAFSRLGMMGLNCTCVDQDVTVTRKRVQAGECFVVVSRGRIVGTMTLYAQDASSPCAHYRRADIATVRQLAIDPSWQGRGIGKSLLAYAEHWAMVHGYAQLALDTPHPARHLVTFYQHQGFRLVDTMRFAGKVYDSAILTKAPVVARTLAAWTHQIALPGARFVRFAA
jgi:GNAT superfamily N-acetyltransferase